MTRFKFFLLLIATYSLITLSANVFAQSFEDYKRQQQQDLEAYKQKEKENFAKFVKERDEMIKKMDQEYSDYLKKAWEDYQGSLKEKPLPEPKPVDRPVYVAPAAEVPPVVVKVEKEVLPEQVVAPVLPIMQKSEKENFEKLTLEFPFYGSNLQIGYDKNFLTTVATPLTSEIIAGLWDKLNTLNYNSLINQLLEYKNQMNLNDWGYFLLIKSTSKKIAPQSDNAAVLIQWFLLTKSNYKARVGYKDANIYLLLPSQNTIYGVPYFTFDNRNFYMLESKEMQIFTYDKDFPEARMVLDMDINSPINTPFQKKERDLTFEYNDKQYTLKVAYNQNAMDFYKDIPQSDISIYFDAVVSAQTKESLVNSIRPMIDGKPEAEAVELILRLVQKSFEYKTDQDQFGFEKPFFPDELFCYPYSDCEDRAALFSYLVRELMDLEVVGLNYPGHMATAVKFTTDVTGDFVTYNNKKYIVCDPTYIGAPIGMAMPQFKDVTAKVIELRNSESKYERANAIWQKLIGWGAYRGGNGKDIDFDSQGNAYVTGYFSDTVTLGSKRLKSNGGTNDIFIAKIDAGDNVMWAYKIGGPGNDIAYNLTLANDNDLYFSGSFNKDIDFAGTLLKTKVKGDVFLAKMTTKGGLSWVNQAGIENLDSTNNVFVASFDATGNRTWIRVYGESEQFDKFGITVDPSGSTFLTGALYSNTGLNVKNLSSTNSYTSFDPAESLINENNKLVNAKYDKSIAGLFAAINLINNSGMSLPGKTVQQTIDKYNPNFRKASPVIYDNLGKIEFIKNSEGIITIRTNDRNPVSFNEIKINHDSKIKISTFSSGNAQVDILSGITVGKSVIWYNLNYIKMFKDSGDLMFDYDVDHTQKKVNLGKDLLK